MTGFQKFIKYAAIAFGIYLSITIILVLLGIANGFVKNSKQSVTEIVENIEETNVKDIAQEYTGITNLEIDLDNIELVIKRGQTLKVEGTNIPDKIVIKQIGNTLKISDDKIFSNFYTVNNALTMYIPEEQTFNTVDIEMNSESADIERLQATNLKLDTHGTICKIDELLADRLEMHNEYGKLNIYKSEVKTLKLDSESGTEDIHMKITGKAEMDLEHANTNITLAGTLEDYQIFQRKQFGNTYLEGKEQSDSRSTIGTGSVKINVEAKYTEMYIDFEETANESYL